MGVNVVCMANTAKQTLTDVVQALLNALGKGKLWFEINQSESGPGKWDIDGDVSATIIDYNGISAALNGALLTANATRC